jgi:hypothetical protein
MSGGDFSIFYTRPLCLGLLVVGALILLASARLAPAEVREASPN